jgi:tetratricopeptide (TPR) repeat protein
MSEAARYRQRARSFEQRENWKRAIEEYENAIEADRRERKEPDLALFNRVGDLYRRVGDVARAVNYYEMAADGHLSAGFYNNAIALCNKILRNQPNRHSAYLKLGKIGAAKGFLSDARRHFLEYAERMQRAGKLDDAFSALIEFADLSPDPEVRLMIADQLIEHERPMHGVEQLRLAWRDLNQEGREADASEVRERILELAPQRDPEVDPPEESTSSAIDAEGVLELPEILPWDEPEEEPQPLEPEPEPELAGEPLEVEPPELEAPAAVVEDLGGDDLGSLEEVGPPAELDLEGIDIDASSLEREIFGGALEDPGLDIMPTSIADDAQAAGVEPPAAADLGIVPTSLAPPAAEPPSAIDEPPQPPPVERAVTPADRVAELESRLRVEGRQADLLFDLAEALLEIGDRDKAKLCLSEALGLHERAGQYRDAGRVLDELLRLNVNDVAAYQKRVEFALRAADRAGLVEAYLKLADCLDRTDASNKARAVYQRVLELDPQNRRAAAALEMFVEEEASAAPTGEPATAAGDYVDLGSIIMEEEAEQKSTRFRIAAADPQSESDVNFAEMLSQFKSKVSEAIEEEDAASHYDLGCAYRDMGLIDEAIAEFQIAARGLDFRLRAIEMLGACFVEKGDHRIALKVLGRALQVPGHTDDELVGIFYAMGRSFETIGDAGRAIESYERVLGCDVNFRDVSQRVASLRS